MILKYLTIVDLTVFSALLGFKLPVSRMTINNWFLLFKIYLQFSVV